MPEEEKPGNAGEGDPQAPENKDGAGADDQNKQGGGGTPPKDFVVPKRNAEYWEAAQKRREVREARKQFFTQKPKDEREGEDGSGGEDEPLTRKEYERLREEDRLRWQEEQDGRLMAQSDLAAIQNFLVKPENEKFRKYEKEGSAILKDPVYSHADIRLIFRGLAYEDALAEGAKRGAKADDKSKRSSAGGSGRTQEPEASGYTPDKHADFKKKLKEGKASFSEPQ